MNPKQYPVAAKAGFGNKRDADDRISAKLPALHEEIGIDDFQANRSPDHSCRTAPLKGLWAHQKGGLYHDGRFSSLLDVVNHYDGFKRLKLSEAEKRDLVQCLLSL